MGIETTAIVTMAAVVGFYMAWNIGANDVANAMGTSVGSKALTLGKAILIAGVFEFAGAFLAGSHVTNTVRKGIVDISLFAEADNGARILMYGMLAAPLGAGVWLQLATYFGRPVSTTHSIIGAIVGFAVAAGGADAVEWSKIWLIVISWVASPLMSGTIAAATFLTIQRLMINVPDPVKGTKRWAPLFVFLVLSILTLVTLFKGLKNLHLDLPFGAALLYASVIGFIGAGVGGVLIRRVRIPATSSGGSMPIAAMADDLRSMVRYARRLRAKASNGAVEHVETLEGSLEALTHLAAENEAEARTRGEFVFVEKVFAYLQILSACFVAFAHGANDVANAIGPVSAVVSLAGGGTEALSGKAPVPLWVLLLGGVGIVVGLSMWGWRIIRVIGEKITELTPTRGFSAEFAAATTIVLASRLGIPISTTHTLVGGVMGVGFARGLASMNSKVLRDIFISWLLELPVAAGLAAGFFFIIKFAFETFGA